MAAGLAELQGRYADIDIGSYPFYRGGRVGTSIVSRGTEEAALEALGGELRTLMRELGAEPIEEVNDPA